MAAFRCTAATEQYAVIGTELVLSWLSAWAWLVLALAGAWLALCAGLGYATYWHGQRERRRRTLAQSVSQRITGLDELTAIRRLATLADTFTAAANPMASPPTLLAVRSLQAQAGLQLLHGALVLALLYVGIAALQQQQLQPAELTLLAGWTWKTHRAANGYGIGRSVIAPYSGYNSPCNCRYYLPEPSAVLPGQVVAWNCAG